MNFQYSNDFKDYSEYLDRHVADCLCKHVCRCDSDKAKALVDASVQIGYYYVWWGYGEMLWTDPERNRMVQLSRVQRFIYDNLTRPIRIVIDKDGDMWLDNLHSTLAQVLCQGMDVMVRNLPVYIVDMRSEIPKIIDGNCLVMFDYKKIQKLLIASKDRCRRVSSEVKTVGYTISDFIKDNDISLDALTITSSEIFNRFLSETDQLLRR